MATPKPLSETRRAPLTPQQETLVLRGLVAGQDSAEIIAQVQAATGRVVSKATISNRRAKYQAQIEAALAESRETAILEGLATREGRIDALTANAQRQQQFLEQTDVAFWQAKGGVNYHREFRDTLRDIARETGQEQPTKLEADVKVEHDVCEELRSRIAGLAARLGAGPDTDQPD